MGERIREERLHALLQFIGIWSAVIAVNAGTLLVGLWALSIDGDPSDERAASSLLSSLLWSTFWPLMWPYLRLTGRNTADRMGRRGARPTSPKGTSQAGIQRFKTIREAKEYLAGMIAREAEREGTPLTEVERKMLFFTETGWTLPDMKEISAEFERDYDQDNYEQKIAAVVTGISRRFVDEDRQEHMSWDLALEKLSKGDHYLFVLVNAPSPTRRGVTRNLRMVIAALIFLTIGGLDLWFRHWLRDH
jgi:hypothetical protein